MQLVINVIFMLFVFFLGVSYFFKEEVKKIPQELKAFLLGSKPIRVIICSTQQPFFFFT